MGVSEQVGTGGGLYESMVAQMSTEGDLQRNEVALVSTVVICMGARRVLKRV